MEEFEGWYRRVRPPMHKALSAWCGDAHVAGDAIDEAFVRALERWRRVGMMQSPEGWLWRTATNQVRRVMRRRSREGEALAQAQPPLGAALVVADVDLQAALLQLGHRQRTAVVLHYLADLSSAEVASVMGVAPGTVHATLHQARERLARVLATPAIIPPDGEEPSARPLGGSARRDPGDLR